MPNESRTDVGHTKRNRKERKENKEKWGVVGTERCVGHRPDKESTDVGHTEERKKKKENKRKEIKNQ